MVTSKIWTSDSFKGVSYRRMAFTQAQLNVDQLRVNFDQRIQRIQRLQLLQSERKHLKLKLQVEMEIEMEYRTATQNEQNEEDKTKAKILVLDTQGKIRDIKTNLDDNKLQLEVLGAGFEEFDLENISPPRSEDGVIQDLQLHEDVQEDEQEISEGEGEDAQEDNPK